MGLAAKDDTVEGSGMRRTSKSSRIALSGVIGAFALSMMLLGSVIPCATFCAPAISGLLLVPVALECGLKTAWLLFAAVAILALILVPEKEMALAFVFILGHYPLVKVRLDRLHFAPVRWAVKLGVFNLSILVMYTLVLTVFPMPELAAEYREMGQAMMAVLLVTANVAFAAYDQSIVNLTRWYVIRIRPKLRFLR